MSSPPVTRPRSNASLPGSTATPPAVPVVVPLVLAMSAAVATWVFVYWPFQAADAAGAETAGAWAVGDEGLAATLPTFGFLTVLLAPLVSMLVAVWAATWAWLSWGELTPVRRSLLLVAALVAAAVVAFHFSPDGRAITRWLID